MSRDLATLLREVADECVRGGIQSSAVAFRMLAVKLETEDEREQREHDAIMSDLMDPWGDS